MYSCQGNHIVLFTTDMTNYIVNPEEQFAKCKSYEENWKDATPSCETAALRSVEDAVQWLNDYRERSPELHLQVLVCGSLHLVGAVMATLSITADNLYES